MPDSWPQHGRLKHSGGTNVLQSLSFLSPQTREQEELEELLLLEQKSTEERRLELLEEEKRQLHAKRKNKQALLDELVRHTHTHCHFKGPTLVLCVS